MTFLLVDEAGPKGPALTDWRYAEAADMMRPRFCGDMKSESEIAPVMAERNALVAF
jgi:hypothetical protein